MPIAFFYPSYSLSAPSTSSMAVPLNAPLLETRSVIRLHDSAWYTTRRRRCPEPESTAARLTNSRLLSPSFRSVRLTH